MRPHARPLAPLALIPLLVMTAACHETNDVVGGGVPPGAMAYHGFDGIGRPVVQGWIRLDLAIVQGVPQPLDFTGTWSLRALTTDRNLGPQVGSGDLTGRFTENGVVVDLNPNRADDNVILTGDLTIAGGPLIEMRFDGTWVWATIAGPRSSGTFRAATP